MQSDNVTIFSIGEIIQIVQLWVNLKKTVARTCCQVLNLCKWMFFLEVQPDQILFDYLTTLSRIMLVPSSKAHLPKHGITSLFQRNS